MDLARISRDAHGRLGQSGRGASCSNVANYPGKWVEGSIPTRDSGVYMKIAERPARRVGVAAPMSIAGFLPGWNRSGTTWVISSRPSHSSYVGGG